MKYVRPSHLALAMLAGTLIAEPASAWTPMAPSVPPPSVRPPSINIPIPNVTPGGGINTNIRDSRSGGGGSSRLRAARDTVGSHRRITQQDRDQDRDHVTISPAYRVKSELPPSDLDGSTAAALMAAVAASDTDNDNFGDEIFFLTLILLLEGTGHPVLPPLSLAGP